MSTSRAATWIFATFFPGQLSTRTIIFSTRTFFTDSSSGTTRTSSCPRTSSSTLTAYSTTSRTSMRSTTATPNNSHVFDAFVDVRLFDSGHDNFDLTFLRAGIQAFQSDFHGLIFNDEGLGGRIFGEFKKNRIRYDIVGLKLFQKNAVSGFIDFSKPSRHRGGNFPVYLRRFSGQGLEQRVECPFQLRSRGTSQRRDISRA